MKKYKKCLFCGNFFEISQGNKLYCSDDCYIGTRRKRARDTYASNPSIRNRQNNRTRLKQKCKKYNISVEDYLELKDKQNNLCAICGRAETRKSGKNSTRIKDLAIDHDHATGEVRGLLCHDCNLSLGLVKDDVLHLKRMICYLEV